MKPTRRRSTRKRPQRKGLAPLEFVLALPSMLFVMALMVNIGSVGAWKVRTQANVRNASWRTMHLRTGDANRNPPMWPASAQVRGGSGSDAAQTDVVWNQFPDLPTPAVRGDAVVEPFNGMSIRVNRMLEMDRGVHDGRAPLQRQIPMLRGVLPRDGQYNIDIQQNVLDGNWEYHNIQYRGEGYARNRDQRVPVLYDIEPEDFGGDVLRLKGEAQRRLAEIQFPQRYNTFDLAPLDADPDLGRLSLLPPRIDPGRPPNPGGAGGPTVGNPPDLYPGQVVIPACLADPSLLRTSQQFNTYLQQVRQLPGRAASVFIRWYQDRLDYLQNPTPPNPGSQQEMQWLQDEIDKLNQFIGALPQQHR